MYYLVVLTPWGCNSTRSHCISRLSTVCTSLYRPSCLNILRFSIMPDTLRVLDMKKIKKCFHMLILALRESAPKRLLRILFLLVFVCGLLNPHFFVLVKKTRCSRQQLIRSVTWIFIVHFPIVGIVQSFYYVYNFSYELTPFFFGLNKLGGKENKKR